MKYQIFSQITQHVTYKVCICKGNKTVYTYDCMKPTKNLFKELGKILPSKVFSALFRDFINSVNVMNTFYEKDFK